MKTGKAIAARLKSAGAFTLAEVMAVVAIMSILVGVGVANGHQMLHSTRQSAAEWFAGELYRAVSASLSDVKNEDLRILKEKGHNITKTGSPLCDALNQEKNQWPTGAETFTLWEFNSGDLNPDNPAYAVLTSEKSATEELWTGIWSVTAVIFSMTGGESNSAFVLETSYAFPEDRRATGYYSLYDEESGVLELPTLSEWDTPALPENANILPDRFSVTLVPENSDELSVMLFATYPETKDFFPVLNEDGTYNLNAPNPIVFTLTLRGQSSGAQASRVIRCGYDEVTTSIAGRTPGVETIAYYKNYVTEGPWTNDSAFQVSCWGMLEEPVDGETEETALVYRMRVVLDSLADSVEQIPFHAQFLPFRENDSASVHDDKILVGERFRYAKDSPAFVPGENIEITVSASCDTGTEIKYAESGHSVMVNSLFASRTGGGTLDDENTFQHEFDRVTVASARHLRNLSPVVSGISDTMPLRVVQESEIALNGIPFTPIGNARIISYDGGGHIISGLAVETNGNAGLFSTFSGSQLNAVTLENPVISGSGYVGGLAGELTGTDVTISNCGLYMTNVSGTAAGARWITTSGANAGGLTGHCAGNLTITNSFAATVVRAERYAGGLVGDAGRLTATGSYADCYLQAANIGGLAGTCGGNSGFTNCYSAGFVLRPDGGSMTAGGFTTGTADVRDSYSLFNFGDTGETFAANVRYAFVRSGNVTNSRYTYEDAEGGGVYTTVTASKTARPYFLTGQTRIPNLLELTHYGDWRARPNPKPTATPTPTPTRVPTSAPTPVPTSGGGTEGRITPAPDNPPPADTEGVAASLEDGQLFIKYVPSVSAAVSAGNTWDLTGWTSGDVPWAPYAASITSVEIASNIGTFAPVSLAGWFSGCSNLEVISGLSNLNTSRVTNMSNLFRGCTSLSTLNLSGFLTGNVTDMSGMFWGCSGLEILDLTSFSTASLTNAESMFRECGRLRVIYIREDAFAMTASVSSAYMFQNCRTQSFTVRDAETGNTEEAVPTPTPEPETMDEVTPTPTPESEIVDEITPTPEPEPENADEITPEPETTDEITPAPEPENPGGISALPDSATEEDDVTDMEPA